MDKDEVIDFLIWLSKYEYSYDNYSFSLVADDYLEYLKTKNK